MVPRTIVSDYDMDGFGDGMVSGKWHAKSRIRTQSLIPYPDRYQFTHFLTVCDREQGLSHPLQYESTFKAGAKTSVNCCKLRACNDHYSLANLSEHHLLPSHRLCCMTRLLSRTEVQRGSIEWGIIVTGGHALGSILASAGSGLYDPQVNSLKLR